MKKKLLALLLIVCFIVAIPCQVSAAVSQTNWSVPKNFRVEIGMTGVTYGSTVKPVLKWDETYPLQYVVEIKDSNGVIQTKVVTDKASYTHNTAVYGKYYWYRVKTKYSKFTDWKYHAYKYRINPTVSVDQTTGKPRISWGKETNVMKYVVYRATSLEGTYIKVSKDILPSKFAKSTQIYYLDSSASYNKKYYYKVYISGPEYGSYTEPKSICCIDRPRNIVVRINPTTGKPVICWDKVTGAKTYLVEVTTRTNTKGEPINFGVVNNTSSLKYEYKNAQIGSKIYYRISSGTTGKSSAYSQGYFYYCPLPIKARLGYTYTKDVYIEFDKLDKAIRYEIQRSDTESFKKYITIDTVEQKEVKTSKFKVVDTSTVPNTEYYYRIVVGGPGYGVTTLPMYCYAR